VKGYWQNKHMYYVAEVISEPIVDVYELRYLDLPDKENRRWCKKELLEHWEYIGDEPIEEE
jgi:hypothetical protein